MLLDLAQQLVKRLNLARVQTVKGRHDPGFMGAGHLVKITQFLLRAEDVRAYGAIRARFLGDARPASTLLIVLTAGLTALALRLQGTDIAKQAA